eukprot:364689-Chlamydomonas_euryale.AAC.4
MDATSASICRSDGHTSACSGYSISPLPPPPPSLHNLSHQQQRRVQCSALTCRHGHHLCLHLPQRRPHVRVQRVGHAVHLVDLVQQRQVRVRSDVHSARAAKTNGKGRFGGRALRGRVAETEWRARRCRGGWQVRGLADWALQGRMAGAWSGGVGVAGTHGRCVVWRSGRCRDAWQMRALDFGIHSGLCSSPHPQQDLSLATPTTASRPLSVPTLAACSVPPCTDSGLCLHTHSGLCPSANLRSSAARASTVASACSSDSPRAGSAENSLPPQPPPPGLFPRRSARIFAFSLAMYHDSGGSDRSTANTCCAMPPWLPRSAADTRDSSHASASVTAAAAAAISHCSQPSRAAFAAVAAPLAVTRAAPATSPAVSSTHGADAFT